jgi:hypothetical protein
MLSAWTRLALIILALSALSTSARAQPLTVDSILVERTGPRTPHRVPQTKYRLLDARKMDVQGPAERLHARGVQVTSADSAAVMATCGTETNEAARVVISVFDRSGVHRYEIPDAGPHGSVALMVTLDHLRDTTWAALQAQEELKLTAPAIFSATRRFPIGGDVATSAHWACCDRSEVQMLHAR